MTDTPPAQASGQAPSAAMSDEIEGLRAHVALLKAALAQAERENDELRAQPAAATAAPPEGWVMVPVEFVRGFNSLAHNYSLRAVPPDYYRGTEGDAFSAAYHRCGQDLAELKIKLAAAPKAEPVPAGEYPPLPGDPALGLVQYTAMDVRKAIDAALTKEREECAKACEYRAIALDNNGNQYVRDHAALDCARSIRARGRHE